VELTAAGVPAAGRQPFATKLDRAHRHAPLVIGVLTLLSVAILLLWDLFPTRFPARAHDVLGALPLGAIALAYLVYQSVRRPSRGELLKATLLAIAFALWALNQLWPDLPQATLLNDLAIALFVLDLFLAIVGWPAPLAAESRAPSPD
jgi:hypothetical protein